MTEDTGDRVRLVAAGQHWLTGSEALPMEDAICGLISDAERTLEMTMFSIWTGYEFADRVWGEITAAAARGVHVYLIINRFHEQVSEAAKRAVIGLMRMGGDTVGVMSFEGDEGILHAKMVVADGAEAIISSSNQSDAGYARNHEIGVLVGGKTAAGASRMFRRLYASNSCQAVTLPRL